MVHKSLDERVAVLESQMADVRDRLADRNGTKNWRQSIGAFTDDHEMLQLLRDAMKIREADRKATRKKMPKSDQ